MDMPQDSSSNAPPPQWLRHYDSPPRPKPKNAGSISNPPGYTEASSSKVSPHEKSSSISILNQSAAICQLPQSPCTQAPDSRRNRPTQDQEILGNRLRPCQSPAYERDNDVHVGQFVTDLQYYDGLHAFQEPAYGSSFYERSISEI